MESLLKIQSELKAPKNQYNKFGQYRYRSCEDILEAAKPILLKHNCVLTISDEIQVFGESLFVKSTATISQGENKISVSALAKHPLEQKGMSDSQITGAASSYARKYALNGLFLIDDTKDADATNTHDQEPKTQQKQEEKPWLNKADFDKASDYLRKGGNIEVIKAKYRISKEMMENLNTLIKQL